MKKVVISISLCLIAAFAFAQNKNVKEAERLVKMGTPDYAEARKLISAALEHPETKDQAKTWYTAGWLESQLFENAYDKLIVGMPLSPAEQTAMYEAILKMLPYFIKTTELDNIPDEKGKVKPKYKNSIKAVLKRAHNYYINGGATAFEAQDFPQAYDFWHSYTTIPDLPIFEGDRDMNRLKADSTYAEILSFEGYVASKMEERQKAIDAYKKAEKTGFKHEEMLQSLAYEYDQAKEMEEYIKILKKGTELYPNSEFFLARLYDYYIGKQQYEDAIETIEEMIRIQPQSSRLYYVLGDVFEAQGDKDKACENFEKAIELDPDNLDAITSLGQIYFNEGVMKNNEINESDQTEARRLQSESRDAYRKAMSYFEKAHSLVPDEKIFLNALRTIYYNLNMGTELDRVEKLLGL